MEKIVILPFYTIPINIEKQMNTISSLICLPLTIILLTHHTINTYKYYKQQSTNLKKNYSLILSFIMLIASILTSITLIIKGWEIDIFNKLRLNPLICDILTHISAITYGIFKYCLYLSLSYRVTSTFHDSIFSISKKIAYIWRFLIVFGFILYCIFWEFDYLYYRHTHIANMNKVKNIPCYHHISLWFIVYLGFFDFCVCIFTLYQFISKLNKMTISMASTLNVDELLFLAKKQTLLGTIAIISTLISLIGYTLIDILYFWIHFDFIICSICILLMFTWNHKYIQYCCGICITKSVKQTNKKIKKKLSKIKINNDFIVVQSIQNKDTPSDSTIISKTPSLQLGENKQLTVS